LFFTFLVFTSLPFFAFADGIVPCGNSNQSPCTLCHLIIGIKRLIDWGKNLLVTITFVGIFISGVMYIISAGEEAMVTQAKKFLSASLIGFTVTMAAWLIVNVAITWVASAKPDLGIGKTGWSTFTCDTTSSALTGEQQQDGLIVEPTEVVFDKTEQTQQLAVKLKDKGEEKDVTKEASYSIDKTDVAEVSKEGLVTNKSTFAEGEFGPKEAKIEIKYQDKTAEAKVVTFSGTCPLGRKKLEKIASRPYRFGADFIAQKALAEESEFYLSDAQPNVFSIEEIRTKGEIWIKICTDVTKISRAHIGMGIMNNWRESPSHISSKEMTNADQEGYRSVAIKFPYQEGELTLNKGVYDLVLDFELSGDKTSGGIRSALEIKDINGGCEPVNPSGLIQYDNRIPLVFVSKDYQISTESGVQEFKEDVKTMSAINNYPVDLSHYTSWISLEEDKNACPGDSRIAIVYVVKRNESDPGCTNGTQGYATLGVDDVHLCSQTIKEDGVNGAAVLTHELGHAQGRLIDEYTMAGESPEMLSGRNCFYPNNGHPSQDACNYFKSIVSGYDCSQIRAGCDYKDSYSRSIERGIMYGVGDGNPSFGEICTKLYEDRLSSLGYRN